MTHDTPTKRIWVIEYPGEAVPRSGEWVAEQSDAPEGVNSYTLTSEAEAMVAAVLREASGVAFDAVFDEMNAVFARNTQRRILALIPAPASAALDKLIAEAEARKYREGWAFAYRQFVATGSVPDPEYRPKEEISEGVWVDVDPESVARAAKGAQT